MSAAPSQAAILAPAQAPARSGFAGVQMLRGLAASGVVLFHLLPFEAKYLGGGQLVPGAAVLGQAGVDVFFVISGFIVTVSTAPGSGRGHEAGLAGAAGFLRRRLWRIYPTYWVYFALLLAVYLVAPGVMNHAEAEQPSLLASFLLLPSSAPPLLLVAWTLTFELYFYLVFALLLATVPRRRLGLALLGWAAATILLRLALPAPRAPLADLAFNPLNLEFIAGCAIGLWGPRARPRLGAGIAAAGPAGAVLLVWLVGAATPFTSIWLRVALMGGLAAVLLCGVVAWEVPGVSRVPAPLRRLGDASYSLYLSHLLAIGAVGLLWRHALAVLPAPAGQTTDLHLLALATAGLAALAVGWASYRLVERPLADRRNRPMRPVLTRPALAWPARLRAGSIR